MEVLGYDLKTVIAGRDLDELRKRLVESKPGPDPTAWVRAAQKWEQFGLTRWSFGDLPERITVVEDPAVFAWPGLAVEDAHVNLRLFRDAASARSASEKGVVALLSLAMEKDLGWLQKDLRALSRFAPVCAGFCTIDELEAGAYLHLKHHLFPVGPTPILTVARFQSALEEARRRLPGLCSRFMDLLEPALKLRQEAARRFTPAAAPVKSPARTFNDLSQLGAAPVAAQVRIPGPTADVYAKLQVLAPKNLLETIPFEKLPDLPRYLKALLVRGERAALNPVKDRERAAQIAPYDAAWQELSAVSNRSEEARQMIEEFRWMLEEFRISVFAQELGTAFPVSIKRLDEHLRRIREA
jgi:ATP-dependent helicase HrpA